MPGEYKQQALMDALRCILESASVPLSEYQLIQYLSEQGWPLSTSAADSLALFTSHFLVYNALYRLQLSYLDQGRYLEISALSIHLSPASDNPAAATALSQQAAMDPSLREYYLDLSHLEKATEASVDALLNQFWTRFAAEDQSLEAFEVLSLHPGASFAEVKQRYRVLAMEHHPDRGGDAAAFQRLNWAFGLLQRLLA